MSGTSLAAAAGGINLANTGPALPLAGSGLDAGTGTITLGGGAFALTAAGQLADASTLAVMTGAAIDVGAFDETVAGLRVAGGDVVGGGVLTVTRDISSTGGAVSAALAGAAGLDLTAGTLVLSGANTYAGATMVAGGTLLIAGNNAGAGGPVAVGAGGTLGGTGVVGGDVTVRAGGTITGGTAGGVGTLTLAAGKALAFDGGTYRADLDPAGASDTPAVSALNDPDGDGITDNFYSNPLYNGDADLGDGRVAPQKVVVNSLINDFLQADKPVAGICHGVTVLAWARVDGTSPLAGKQVAVPHLEGSPDQFYAGAWRNGGYTSGQRDQVVANGGLATPYSGAHGNPGAADDVIVDGRIITAENPESAALFGATLADEVLAALPAGTRLVGGDLVVTGTPAADTMYLWSGGAANQVYAWVNGTGSGPFVLPANGHVKVFGGAGNDQVFGTDLRVGLVARGGAGHDLLVGGAAGDVIDGDDGVDRVWGGLGDDVLVGGRTAHDHDDAVLGGLRGVWLAPGDLTPFDDGTEDVLVGGAGSDWLLRGPGDGVYLLDPGDRVSVL